jgi:carbon monoxide dehydrogenase subunit G
MRVFLVPRAQAAGGFPQARRRFVLVMVVLAGLMQAGAAADERSTSEFDIAVREQRGVYSVTARFQVSQPPDVVRAVLTDYEAIPEFLPHVKSSVVLEREPGRAVVRQEASSRFMLFSKRVHLVLEIDEESHHLGFQDRSKQSFARYEGSWCFNPADAGTEILYQLVADPAFDVPGFILKRLLQRDSEETIRHLREEIATRAARPLR